MTTAICRTCSECDGQHHWLEHFDDPDSEETPGSTWCGFVCKHCEARADLCGECDNPVFPAADRCSECVSLMAEEPESVSGQGELFK